MVLNKDDTLSYAKTSECSFVFSPIAVSRKVNMGGSLRMLKGYGGGKRLKTPEFDLSFIISGSSDTVVWREFLLPRGTEDALLAVTVRRKLRLLCTALSNTFAVS